MGLNKKAIQEQEGELRFKEIKNAISNFVTYRFTLYKLPLFVVNERVFDLDGFSGLLLEKFERVETERLFGEITFYLSKVMIEDNGRSVYLESGEAVIFKEVKSMVCEILEVQNLEELFEEFDCYVYFGESLNKSRINSKIELNNILNELAYLGVRSYSKEMPLLEHLEIFLLKELPKKISKDGGVVDFIC